MRSPPPTLSAKVVDEVEYSAEAFTVKRWFFANKWKCDVIAKQDGKELWRKEAYSFSLNPIFEADVQWIFPKEIIIDRAKIPNIEGKYNVNAVSVVDEKNNYHRVLVDQ